MSSRTTSRAAFVAVALCALPLLAALVVPFYSGTSSNGRTSHQTLVQVNGGRVLAILAIPLAVTFVGLVGAHSRIARPALVGACLLMWIWTLLAAFTVGFLYIPADIALIVAAAALPSRRNSARSPLPAPGWYPDPSGAAMQLRWWDGHAWTPRVAASS